MAEECIPVMNENEEDWDKSGLKLEAECESNR